MKHPETWSAIRALIAFRSAAPRLTAATTDAPRPLSFPQERLFFLQELHPDSTAFHLPHLLHLEGELDVAALECSLNALRDRHSILRTLFAVDEQGQPVQKVQAASTLSLSVTDVANLAAEPQEKAVADFIASIARQPFQLHKETGMRVGLLRLHARAYQLLLVFHHIVYDFWSQSVLLSELQTLYAAFSSATEPALPKLSVEYGDFSLWQRDWLGAPATQAPLRAYWQKQLSDLSSLPLPTSERTSRHHGGSAGAQRFSLSPVTTAALKALAQQENETLYTTLCAAFKVLVHRYTGKTDIALSGLMANRGRPDLDSLIGNFVNLLPLRTDLSGDPTFREVIGRVRKTMAGAIQHQDLPTQLLDSPLRLTQVVFAFRNTPQHQIVLPGLSTRLEVLPSEQSDFDLFLDLIEQASPDGVVLSGPVTYSRDCFAPETVAQLLSDFTALLDEVVSEPDKHLSELPHFAWPQSAAPLQEAAPERPPQAPAGRRKSPRYGRPQTAMEQRLAAIWRRVLGLAEVDLHSTFFELGGSSLMLLRLHQQLQAAVSQRLSPVDLVQHPTIHALAEHLEQQGAASSHHGSPRMSERTGASPLEGIAIVGMAGRFPQAPTLAKFWQNLCAGVESIREFTDEELRAAGVPEHVFADPGYVRTAPVLDDIKSFDAAFFGLAPSEAKLMDPQHRLLLECAWEAFEDAGIDPEAYGGRIGVYAGANYSTYLLNNLLTQPDFILQMATGDSFQLELASDKDNAATRISHALDLKGPGLCVSTACATSLVALHLACQSLRQSESDMALVGAANVLVPQNRGYLYREGRIFSTDGHCRAFDARANGTMLGSGAGVVLLKRLSDALLDHDPIYAVIRGTALNNDGSEKIGYTAPSVSGQAAVIAEAQALAGVEPGTVGYVEAHGTATSLGDPVEVTALSQAFRAGTAKRQFCALGSVKTNIGHLSKAAGMAGLIKTALALKHKQIPPSLHFSTPNPQIDFQDSPFFVNTELRPWANLGPHPRRAGVSAFGTGGTNAHAVLEEAPPQTPSGEALPFQLLPLSGRSAAAVETMAQNLAAHLRADLTPDDDPRLLADVAYTLQTGRRHFEVRRAVICQSRAHAIAQLSAPTAFPAAEPPNDRPAKIAFLFTGQGSQRAEMGKQLYETEPRFRQVLDRCSEILQPALGLSLSGLLYREDTAKADRLLDEATYAQPALFAIEYALAELWLSWGVEPDVVIGHSMGEYAAACVAGVFSLEDGLKLIATRGRLMQTSAQAGQMMAVLGSEEVVRRILEPFAARVSLAAINTVESLVISGHREAVLQAAEALRMAGVKTKELKIFVASHSPLMEPILGEFAETLRSIKKSPPRLQVVSNVTGATVGEALLTVDYWLCHMREPVRFADGMATLEKLGVDVFLEMGPAPTLLGLGQDCLPADEARLWLPSLQPSKPDWEQLLTSLGALYVRGVPIDWHGVSASEQRRRVRLPTYPYSRKVCWVEPGSGAPAERPPNDGQGTAPYHPLLGQRLRSAIRRKELTFEAQLSARSPDFLADYGMAEAVLLPSSAYLEISLAAARQASGGADALVLEDVVFAQALILPEDGAKILQCILSPLAADAAQHQFQIFSLTGEEWTLHAQGLVHPAQATDADSAVDREALAAACPQTVPVSAHYERLLAQGLVYGESYRLLQELWQGPGAALGRIHCPERFLGPAYTLHPVVIEACMQILGAALPSGETGYRYRVAGLDRLFLHRRPAPTTGTLFGSATTGAAVGNDTLQADLALFDKDGLLARISGLSLQRVLYQPLASAHGRATTARPDSALFLHQLAATPESARRALLATHVRTQIAAVLGLDEPEQIGQRLGLFDLGLDSMLAVELRNRLQKSLGRKFRTTLLFDYPTLEALTGHIAEALLPGLCEAEPHRNQDALAPAQASSDAQRLSQVRSEVERLTEAEVEASLAAELAALEALLS